MYPARGEAALDIVLSSAQQQRFACALRTLLSPLAYLSTQEWRRAVSESLEQLFDADHVTFRIPGSEPDRTSSDAPRPALGLCPTTQRPVERRFAIVGRVLELGVFNRELLLDVDLPAHESDVANDYIVVNEAYDWLALAAAMPSDRGGARVAHIVLHSDPTNGRAFGDRGLGLVRLLFPAFRAGINTHFRMVEERRVLGGVIDRLSDGLLICDPDGNVVHQSAALTALLRDDPDGADLLAKMRTVGQLLAGLLAAPETARREDADVLEYVRTEQAHYRVRGTFVGEGVLSPAFRIIVALEQLSPALPGERDVRKRFGLTPKQARVCLLLARGKTNEEIANALCISRYTARRHTENVLGKLQVKSRAEIAPALLYR